MGDRGSIRVDLDLRDSLSRRLFPQAVVLQEDRNLILGPQHAIDLDDESELGAAYLAVREHRPLPLGRYILLRRRGGPPHWVYQAVVHDLDARPTCRPGDIRRSLTAILDDAMRRGCASGATELLGCCGQARGLGIGDVATAFDRVILETSTLVRTPLRLVILLESLSELEEMSHLLRSRLLHRASRSFRTVTGDAAVVEIRHENHRYHCRFVPGSLSGYLMTRATNVA